MVLYCLWLSQHSHYAAFRYAEVEALLGRRGLTALALWGGDKPAYEPETSDVSRKGDTAKMVFVNLPARTWETALKEIVQESVSVKMLVECFCVGEDMEAVVESAHRSVDPEAFRKSIQDNKSFAWVCDSAGKSVTLEHNVELMNKFMFLFTKKEKANLKSPGIEFAILNQYNEKAMEKAVFGKVLAKRDRNNWMRIYDLPIRPILGPTTLDNELAFLMAHMAGIEKTSRVLDPFCGSGGLLVASTVKGGTCFGSDLDSRVLRGWGVAYKNLAVESPVLKNSTKTDISCNFKHYGLRVPEVVRMDNSITSWRANGWADVVITDPPYGIRAMARETAGYQSPGSFASAGTVVRDVPQIVVDMLETSQKALRIGGRLVCLLPVAHETRNDMLADMTTKAAARGFEPQLAPSYQILHGGVGRFGLCFTKVR